jgi:hypothetical protein
MNRLEIIHLRTAGPSFATLAQLVREAIGPGVDDNVVVTRYRRNGLETDVAIHIAHRESGEGADPSDLGLHVASALSAYGLVEHTLWEELP